MRGLLRALDPRGLGITFKLVLAMGLAATIVIDGEAGGTGAVVVQRRCVLLALLGAALAFAEHAALRRPLAEMRRVLLEAPFLPSLVGRSLLSIVFVWLALDIDTPGRAGLLPLSVGLASVAWTASWCARLEVSSAQPDRGDREGSLGRPVLALAPGMILALTVLFLGGLPGGWPLALVLAILGLGSLGILFKRYGTAILVP